MLNPLDIKTLEKGRLAAGLSRAELSERSGVNLSTIWRIEKGKMDPSVDAVWSKLVTAIKNCRKRSVKNGA